jgi:hypothetical protein
MNKLLSPLTPLTLPPSGRGLLLALGPHLRQLHPAVLEQAARLALAGPLLILDGGNCLDLYGLARQLRRLQVQVKPLLERIQVARTFTCYQTAALLAQVAHAPAGSKHLPTIILDLLSTFLDENVPLPERQRLLGTCLADLQCLAEHVPVLVTARSACLPGSESLLNLLCGRVDHLWRPPQPLPPPAQLRLFP